MQTFRFTGSYSINTHNSLKHKAISHFYLQLILYASFCAPYSLQKNFGSYNKAEIKETMTKAPTIAHESAKNKAQPDTGYQLVPPSRSYILPKNTNDSSSIAQAVGNVASTALKMLPKK